jgi:CrcB protein
MVNVIFIAIGASLGAIMRYGIQGAFAKISPSFPLGTLIVNLLGSFTFGFIVAFWPQMSATVRAGILTGFLGALTTFSSFSFEFFVLFNEKRFLFAATYWFFHSTVIVGACFLGYYIGLIR